MRQPCPVEGTGRGGGSSPVSLETSYESLALRPAAKMNASTQQLPASTNISFDQVEFDTGGLINLDVDQQLIAIPTIPGPANQVWFHGAYAVISGAGVNTDQTNVSLRNPGGTYGADQRDIAAFNAVHAGMMFRLTSADTEPRLYTFLAPSIAGAPLASYLLTEWAQFGFKVGDTQ